MRARSYEVVITSEDGTQRESIEQHAVDGFPLHGHEIQIDGRWYEVFRIRWMPNPANRSSEDHRVPVVYVRPMKGSTSTTPGGGGGGGGGGVRRGADNPQRRLGQVLVLPTARASGPDLTGGSGSSAHGALAVAAGPEGTPQGYSEPELPDQEEQPAESVGAKAERKVWVLERHPGQRSTLRELPPGVQNAVDAAIRSTKPTLITSKASGRRKIGRLLLLCILVAACAGAVVVLARRRSERRDAAPPSSRPVVAPVPMAAPQPAEPAVRPAPPRRVEKPSTPPRTSSGTMHKKPDGYRKNSDAETRPSAPLDGDGLIDTQLEKDEGNQ